MALKVFCKKTAFICLETLGVIIIAAVVLGVGFAWRLLSAPMDLEFAKPHVESALSDEATGISVTTENIALYWPEVNKPLLLGLQGAKVTNADGNVIASVDEIALNLDKSRLLMGQVRIEGLIIQKPSLSIIRRRDNSFDIDVADLENFGPPKRIEDKGPSFIDTVLSNLNGEAGESGVVQLADLQRFEIEDARVFINDRVLGVSWSLPRADIAIERDDGLIVGALRLEEPDAPLNTVPFEASVLLDPVSGNIDAKAFLRKFDIYKLGEKIPELERLKNQKLQLDAEVQVNVSRDLVLNSMIMHFESEGGELNIEEWSADPVGFENLRGDVQYFAENQTFELTEFGIDFPGIPIVASAKFQKAEDKLSGIAKLDIAQVEHGAIEPLWPLVLAEDNAREWVVEKIQGGTFSNLFTYTDIEVDLAGEEPAFDLTSLRAGFDFKDASIDYRAPLAPATNARGTGVFNLADDALIIDIHDSKMLDMDVSDAVIELTDVVAEGKGRADIKFELAGPVKSVLQYIQADPINAKNDIDLDNTKGRARMDVHIDLPTQDGIKMSDVIIDIQGQMNDVVLPNLVKGLTLTGGPFDARVKDNLLMVKGKGQLAGEPIEAEYREFLESEGQPYKMQVDAKLTATEKLRSDFGIDISDFVSGSAHIDVQYTETDDVNASATVKANLRPSRFYVDPFNYEKQPGQDGSASLKAVLKNGSLVRIEALKVVAPSYSLEPSTLEFRTINGEEELSAANISRLLVGETIVKIDAEVLSSGLMKIVMNGPFIDLRPFLHEDEGDRDEPYDNPPMQISIKADTVRTADEETIQYGQIYADIDGQGKFNQLEMDAIAGGGDVYLRYKPDDQGMRVFRLEADNAGATLKAFDLYQNVRGGKLVIYAEPKGWLLDRNLVGTAEMSNFKVVEAPALARLVSALSLTGVQQTLSGEGLTFTKLEAKFDWLFRPNGSLLVLKDGRTSGNALGLTFDGTFDNAADTVDVAGTLIPLSGVNKAIGNIPLVGDIITGGTGSLFAATYSLKGSAEDPKVSVNPLSVLAPGILRRILFQN